MTKKGSKGTARSTKQSKRVSLSKETIKDLSVRGKVPKGGKGIYSLICAPSVKCLSAVAGRAC